MVEAPENVLQPDQTNLMDNRIAYDSAVVFQNIDNKFNK